MRISTNVASQLGLANTNTTTPAAEKLLLNGDLGQMGTMKRRLQAAGFTVVNADVYPVIEGADEIKRALQYLYDNFVEGWWNQRQACIKYGIATFEEFQAHFDHAPRTRNTD